MRVVAGSARGHRLVAPAGHETRPTSDRIRGAVFNSLHSWLALDGATVLDLFAGSGALGIEALSRGAVRCTFVEQSPTAARAIRTNLDTTGLGTAATVVVADATTWCAQHHPVADLCLADPPYRFDGWTALLASVDCDVLALESDRLVELSGAYDAVRTLRHGDSVVTLGRRTDRAEVSEVSDP